MKGDRDRRSAIFIDASSVSMGPSDSSDDSAGGRCERGVAPDMTEQPITSGQRYRALIQASTSVVWRADRTGSIVEAWGWTELADQPQLGFLGEGWLEALHPDDRQKTTKHW